MHTKINIPEHIREQVRIAYRDYPYAEKNVIQIANEYGFNPKFLYRHAIKMGVQTNPKKKHKNWTEREIKIVMNNLDKSDYTIAKHFKRVGLSRSPSEIFCFRKYYSYSYKTGNFLTVSQFAECLGVTPHAVNQWIKTGRLIAVKMEKQLGPNIINKISFKNAKQFVIENVLNINFQYVDKYFIVNLLTDRL